MFGRVIWDKLPKFIFVNFGIARVKRGQLKIFFENHESDLSKSRANQTCDYWLITPNQQTLYIETNIDERGITKQRTITK